jgi:hypothetical protein
MQHVHWMDPDWKTSWGLGFSIWRSGETTMVGHGGSCPGYRTEVVIAPQERFGVAFLSNAIDGPARVFTQGAYDLVAPLLAKMDEEAKRSGAAPGATAPAAATQKSAEPAAGEPAAVAAPPTFDASRYAGVYQSVWGESLIVAWEDGVAVLQVPTDTPKKSLEKFRHVDGDTFRRVRDDGELGETLTFEADAQGKVLRAVRHGNAVEKVR